MTALVQSTNEWLEYRQNKIGASDSPIIMGVSPWKTPFQLWQEKLGIVSCESNYQMQRGHDLEDKARKAFEIENELEVCPKVVVHPEHEWMIASLDGIDIENKNIVEIKCPGMKDHSLALSGQIPEKYYPQLQHQLAVTGLEMAYYYSYDGEKGVTLKVFRNEKYINNLIAKAKEFYECMQQLTPPALTPRDFTKKNDEAWIHVSKRWQTVKKQLKDLEKDEMELRQWIISMSEGKNSEGNGIRVTKCIRKGNVDYDQIPELKHVDLEKYRNQPFVSWRILEQKAS